MTWKYFKQSEIEGIEPALVEKLDTLVRPYYGPIVITKNGGYRTPAVNKTAGGVEDSAHTHGLAVDIHCPNPFLLEHVEVQQQIKLAWLMGLAGFNRLGAYDRHIHVDLDSTKPHPAFWTGESK